MKNRNLLHIGCAFAALAVTTAPAYAQDAQDSDVLVLRRVIAQPAPPGEDTTVKDPSATMQWTYGPWSAWDSMCSNSATRTRKATCYATTSAGTTEVNDPQCDATQKEITTQTAGIYEGCTPTWQYGEYGWNGVEGAKSSTCSDAPQQTRTATCELLTANGLEEQPAEACGVKSTTKTLLKDYSGCTYKWVPKEWSDWSSSCSDNATRTRVTQCIREQTGEPVATDNCEAGHPDSVTEETSANNSGCGEVLLNGGFESGFSDWKFSTVASYGHVADDPLAGSKVARLLNGAARLEQRPTANVEVGDTITISVRCRYTATNGFTLQFQGGGISTAFGLKCPKESYATEKYEFTATQASTGLYIRFYGSSSTASYQVDIDHVSIVVK